MEHNEISRRGVVAGAAAMGALAAVGAGVATSASAANPVLKAGSRGSSVTALQKRLNSLGYWCGTPDGVFGALTVQAVLAIQKVAGLGRDGVVGAKTWGAVNRGTRPGSRRGGNRMEVDKRRQIVMVVRGGSVKYILNTSTGNGELFTYYGRKIRATTPSGEFRINRRGSNGWDYGALGGLWRPFYFNGGIAFHGSASIPAYPASHGCCRLSVSAQNFLIANRLLYIGEPVSVY